MINGGPAITLIEPITVAFEYSHDGPLTGFGGSNWKKLACLLIRVETEDGMVGWGEAFGYTVIPATIAVLKELIVPLAVGRDASDIAGLMESLKHTLHIFGRGGPTQYALSGLDIALWDLAGKRAGCPVGKLLGGRGRENVPAYTSLMKLKEDATIRTACERAVQRGYRLIKLHESTEPAVATARAAVGPDVDLMLDVNCAWTPREAIEMTRRLEKHQLKWVEEPIWPPEDVESLRKLRNATPVPVAAGENLANAWAFRPYADGDVLDYLQPSVTKVGGISEVMKVIGMAEFNGCRVAPHSPYFGPGLLATLQIASASRLIGGIESFGVRLHDTLYGGAGLPGDDGTIDIPDAPGLGVDPDPETIDRLRTDRAR